MLDLRRGKFRELGNAKIVRHVGAEQKKQRTSRFLFGREGNREAMKKGPQRIQEDALSGGGNAGWPKLTRKVLGRILQGGGGEKSGISPTGKQVMSG